MTSLRVDVLYLLLIILCVVELLTLTARGWHARRTPGGHRFVLFCASAVAWSALVGGMAVTRPETARLLLSLKYVAIALCTVSLFLFVCQRTGALRRVAPRHQRAFFLPPLAGAVASTRETWGMVRDIEWGRAHDLTFIQYIGFGPTYWLYTGYLYALLIASVVLLLSTRREPARLPRAQASPLLLGVTSPLLANVFLISGIAPRTFDPMPLGLAIAGGALWWGVMRHQVLELAPLARHALVDALDDGILILDDKRRILDLNEQLSRLTNLTAARAVGLPVHDCAFGHPELRAAVFEVLASSTVDPHRAGDVDRGEVRASVTLDGREHELRSLRLPTESGTSGVTVLILHDVTARARLEREQRRLIDELQSTLREVRTLRGLLPICAGCKQIRDESGEWQPVEEFVRQRTHAEFSHGLCPACVAKWYPEFADL